MTFYRFFPNKLELAKAVFDEQVDNGLAAFRNILESDTLPAEEKIRKMLVMKMDGTHEISREFLQDFYNNPELGLKDHIELKTRTVWLEIMEDFKKAQERKFSGLISGQNCFSICRRSSRI